jgi:hypothetical protein
MKSLFVKSLSVLSFSCYAQVGIGTTAPSAHLDVNGDLKIRTILLDTDLNSAKDSILVVKSGLINRITSKQIFDSNIKSFVKATGASSTVLGLSIGSSGFKRIAFTTELFDENNDYNPISYEFLAPKDGIYNVYVQYEVSSLFSASNVGVAIFTERAGVLSIAAQEAYDNIAIVSTTVSPPTRSTQTLLKLNAGDKIFFGASASLTITLVGGVKSYFTINQVK